MISSVSLVLANSFAGQLLSGEGIKTDFSVETQETEGRDEGSETVDTEADTDKVVANASIASERADETRGRETVTFAVDLNCGGCEDRITETLRDHDGVHDVDADSETKRVSVTFNPHVTATDDLQTVIVELGYTVN